MRKDLLFGTIKVRREYIYIHVFSQEQMCGKSFCNCQDDKVFIV
jgi:hypothetical protein